MVYTTQITTTFYLFKILMNNTAKKSQESIIINNFNLEVFEKFLKQSLIVNSQLMIMFNDNKFTSCCFSASRQFLKIISISLDDLIYQPDNSTQINKGTTFDVLDLTPDLDKQISASKQKTVTNDIPKIDKSFMTYFISCEKFMKFLNVFGKQKCVDIEFKISNDESDEIIISGTSSNLNTKLKTKFAPDDKSLMSIGDLQISDLISKCTPSNDMHNIVLNINEVKEIKSLLKDLQNGRIDNTSFIQCEIKNHSLKIENKAFEISLPIKSINDTQHNTQQINDSFELVFNIYKDDFTFFNEGDLKILFSSSDSNSKIIYINNNEMFDVVCLSNKVSNYVNTDNVHEDDILPHLDLQQYGLEADDDIPF